MTTLQILVGLAISKVEILHDYIQIVFSDKTTLDVFNTYTYEGSSILDIEGKRIGFVEESDNEITITLENGAGIIFIGLSDRDYKGPEALILRQYGKSPIVWN